MKKTALNNVLYHEPGEDYLDLDRFRANDLIRAARAWVGKGVSLTTKAQAYSALEQGFKKGGKEVLANLTETQCTVLEVVARYGERVSGCLLGAELKARGIENARGDRFSRTGVAEQMESRMFLFPKQDYWRYRNTQPDVQLPPSIAKAVSPCPPVPWPANAFDTAEEVKSTGYRSSAEVHLDFWAVHEALVKQDNWNPLKGGALPKSIRNRLKKAVGLPRAEVDPLQPPDPESLYYELMRGMGLAHANEYEAFVDDPGEFATLSPAVFVSEMIRAWMHRRLWQDGIGVVPDRDSEYEVVRIEPERIETARLLLSWGLQRLAHTAADWVSLESFLIAMYDATASEGFNLYWADYTWEPKFKLAKNKATEDGDRRQLAHWLDDEGIWASNALMVTLYTLGLTERGTLKNQPYFRLTRLGRIVFGAPENQETIEPGQRKFLVVQANFDVTLYLRDMDCRDLQHVLPFLTKTSSPGGQVQGFRLERERVYKALEEGLSIDDILDRLTEHGREALPAVVVRALSEWAGKREALTLRRNVGVVFTEETELPKKLGPRELASGCWLVKGAPTTLAKALPDAIGIDHSKMVSPEGNVSESGLLTFPKGNSLDTVTRARLATIAEGGTNPLQWQVTHKSVRAGADLGIPGEQAIAWLSDMLESAAPPALLATAIRQWTKARPSFFGNLCVIQIADPEAFHAVCHSKAFSDLIAGVIPPRWAVVRSEQAKEAKKTLQAYGFNLKGTPNLDSPESVPPPSTLPEAASKAEKAVRAKKPRRRRSRFRF